MVVGVGEGTEERRVGGRAERTLWRVAVERSGSGTGRAGRGGGSGWVAVEPGTRLAPTARPSWVVESVLTPMGAELAIFRRPPERVGGRGGDAPATNASRDVDASRPSRHRWPRSQPRRSPGRAELPGAAAATRQDGAREARGLPFGDQAWQHACNQWP